MLTAKNAFFVQLLSFKNPEKLQASSTIPYLRIPRHPHPIVRLRTNHQINVSFYCHPILRAHFLSDYFPANMKFTNNKSIVVTAITLFFLFHFGLSVPSS